MAKQIVIKPNYIVLQETKDGNIVSALGYNKGGLSYLIDNHSIKFYLVEDYFYKNAVWSAGFPLLVGDALYDEDTIEDALKDIFVREIETMTVDTQLNTGSTNPIANSVVAQNFETTNSKFDDYYEKTEVDALLDTKADASSIPTDYYDRSETDALLANKADVSDIPSLDGYATEYWVQHQGYLTQHQSLAGLASEDWVLAKHYLTEHQSLEDYYDKDQVITLLSTKMDKSALDEYATKEWVDEQGYLKHHQQIKRLNGQSMTGSGDVIIDAQTLGVYTSGQTAAFLATKADKSELNDYALKTDLDGKLDVSALTEYWTSGETQDAITAAVSGKVDSSTLEDYYTKLETDGAISSAISGKADVEDLDNFYQKSETDSLLDEKQDVLSAGTGIEITDNVISVTLDTELFVVVQELPVTGVTNKIYLVPTENSGSNDVYVEYLYTNNAWEKLGEEQIEVDLTPYLQKTEAASTYLSKTDAASTYATKTELGDKVDTSSMTDYYTSSQVDSAITAAVSGKADSSDLANYALKSELPTIDTAITSGGTNAVEGSAIYTALAAKVSFTDVDSTLNSGSTNPISNQAVYNAIGNVEALLATI